MLGVKFGDDLLRYCAVNMRACYRKFEFVTACNHLAKLDI